MRHSNKERDNVAKSRPGSNTAADHTARGCTVVLSKNGEPRISVSEWVHMVSPVGLERIHQVTNTIRIANIGWRIRICIREYTFFSEAINFIRQCSKFHTVIMLSNLSI